MQGVRDEVQGREGEGEVCGVLWDAGVVGGDGGIWGVLGKGLSGILSAGLSGGSVGTGNGSKIRRVHRNIRSIKTQTIISPHALSALPMAARGGRIFHALHFRGTSTLR